MAEMVTYAIVETDGREYRLHPGEVVDIDYRRDARAGDRIVLDRVLLLCREGEVKVGEPYVEGARVEVEVVEPLKKGPKVRGMVRILRNSMRYRYGHRQKYTTVRVVNIE